MKQSLAFLVGICLCVGCWAFSTPTAWYDDKKDPSLSLRYDETNIDDVDFTAFNSKKTHTPNPS